jgi:hypothetical protein
MNAVFKHELTFDRADYGLEYFKRLEDIFMVEDITVEDIRLRGGRLRGSCNRSLSAAGAEPEEVRFRVVRPIKGILAGSGARIFLGVLVRDSALSETFSAPEVGDPIHNRAHFGCPGIATVEATSEHHGLQPRGEGHWIKIVLWTDDTDAAVTA